VDTGGSTAASPEQVFVWTLSTTGTATLQTVIWKQKSATRKRELSDRLRTSGASVISQGALLPARYANVHCLLRIASRLWDSLDAAGGDECHHTRDSEECRSTR
jgi:hypothetical protein